MDRPSFVTVEQLLHRSNVEFAAALRDRPKPTKTVVLQVAPAKLARFPQGIPPADFQRSKFKTPPCPLAIFCKAGRLASASAAPTTANDEHADFEPGAPVLDAPVPLATPNFPARDANGRISKEQEARNEAYFFQFSREIAEGVSYTVPWKAWIEEFGHPQYEYEEGKAER